MSTEQQDKRAQAYMRMRAILDYGMGAIYLMVAYIFISNRKLNVQFLDEAGKGFHIALGCVFLLYGAFRIYRGIAKKY
jgi:hypothetical protein